MPIAVGKQVMRFTMKNILVVDDEIKIRDAISVLLEEKGYGVRKAENGKEGIKELDKYNPDLVITDISMPDMDGIEFLKTIRKHSKDLPVIVMSGNAVGQKFLKAASLFGSSAALIKPFSNKDLIELVKKLLEV